MKHIKHLASAAGALSYVYLAISAACDFFSGALLADSLSAIHDPALLLIAMVVLVGLGAYSITSGIDYISKSYDNSANAIVALLLITYGLTFYLIATAVTVIGTYYYFWCITYSLIFISLSLLLEHSMPCNVFRMPQTKQDSAPKYVWQKLAVASIYVLILLAKPLWG